MTEPTGVPWTALDEANQNRARLYVEFFRAIEGRLGRDLAINICKEAIRNWGRGLASGLETQCPKDFFGLIESFAMAPDGGAMFRPVVDRCDEAGLDVTFERCPLQIAWREAGLSDSDIELFCKLACEADYGTLEAAGFDVEIESWKPGRKHCCRLSIRPHQKDHAR
jgi:hypothetical protein